MDEKLNYWQKQIEEWGQKVGLYDKENGSNWLNQITKYEEEKGELAKGLIKNNQELIIDSIGDTFVTLVHANKFRTNILFLYKEHVQKMYEHLSLKEINQQISYNVIFGNYNYAVTGLLVMSKMVTGDPFKCIEVAYNEIKDREGRMINGSFIKREDLEKEGLWH